MNSEKILLAKLKWLTDDDGTAFYPRTHAEAVSLYEQGITLSEKLDMIEEKMLVTLPQELTEDQRNQVLKNLGIYDLIQGLSKN